MLVAERLRSTSIQVKPFQTHGLVMIGYRVSAARSQTMIDKIESRRAVRPTPSHAEQKHGPG